MKRYSDSQIMHFIRRRKRKSKVTFQIYQPRNLPNNTSHQPPTDDVRHSKQVQLLEALTERSDQKEVQI